MKFKNYLKEATHPNGDPAPANVLATLDDEANNLAKGRISPCPVCGSSNAKPVPGLPAENRGNYQCIVCTNIYSPKVDPNVVMPAITK